MIIADETLPDRKAQSRSTTGSPRFAKAPACRCRRPAGGTSSTSGILAQRLRAGKTVGLVCDRDVTGRGMEVEFFGEKARMMGGAAALAVQTGAALMPVISWFEGNQWARMFMQRSRCLPKATGSRRRRR